jgi:hypothetical protein
MDQHQWCLDLRNRVYRRHRVEGVVVSFGVVLMLFNELRYLALVARVFERKACFKCCFTLSYQNLLLLSQKPLCKCHKGSSC